MKVEFDTRGVDAAMARMRGLQQKKINAAAAAALNDAARAGYEQAGKEISLVFDKPTPWVSRSIRYKKARSDNLEAKVDFSGDGNKQMVTVSQVLAAEISGGARKQKRHEVALSMVGVLPPGYMIVPGEAANMDAFGNMSVGQIRQILSYFNAAEMTSGAMMNTSQRKKASLRKGNAKKGTHGFEYFVVKPGATRTWSKSGGKTGSHKMQPGIYQRVFLGHGTAIRPVMIFVRSTNYRKRYDFYGIAKRAAEAQFKTSFSHYLSNMLAERGL